MNPNNHCHFKRTANDRINQFWDSILEKAKREPLTNGFALPLARIKRLMKVEEDVKMVASEVPILFSKVTEKFVEDLTLRAWINTEENKRRILQKNDLSFASRTSDMFDFLIYIIPRIDGLMGLDRLDTIYDPKMNDDDEECDEESQ